MSGNPKTDSSGHESNMSTRFRKPLSDPAVVAIDTPVTKE